MQQPSPTGYYVMGHNGHPLYVPLPPPPSPLVPQVPSTEHSTYPPAYSNVYHIRNSAPPSSESYRHGSSTATPSELDGLCSDDEYNSIYHSQNSEDRRSRDYRKFKRKPRSAKDRGHSEDESDYEVFPTLEEASAKALGGELKEASEEAVRSFAGSTWIRYVASAVLGTGISSSAVVKIEFEQTQTAGALVKVTSKVAVPIGTGQAPVILFGRLHERKTVGKSSYAPALQLAFSDKNNVCRIAMGLAICTRIRSGQQYRVRVNDKIGSFFMTFKSAAVTEFPAKEIASVASVVVTLLKENTSEGHHSQRPEDSKHAKEALDSIEKSAKFMTYQVMTREDVRAGLSDFVKKALPCSDFRLEIINSSQWSGGAAVNSANYNTNPHLRLYISKLQSLPGSPIVRGWKTDRLGFAIFPRYIDRSRNHIDRQRQFDGEMAQLFYMFPYKKNEEGKYVVAGGIADLRIVWGYKRTNPVLRPDLSPTPDDDKRWPDAVTEMTALLWK